MVCITGSVDRDAGWRIRWSWTHHSGRDSASRSRKGLSWVADGFVFVAFAATVARWMLVGRLLDIRVRALAVIFLTACVAVAGSAGAGSSSGT